MRARSIPAAVLVALLASSGASAHVTVTPSSNAAAAARGEVTLSVPSESQDSDTTSVAVRLPANAIDVEVPAVAGWRASTTTVALQTPVEIGGRTVTTRVDTVTWTGRLAPGRRATLRLRVRVRAGTTRRGLAFPAVQRYADGTVVRWIGPAGSDTPAGVLRAPVPVVVAAAPSPPTTPPSVPSPVVPPPPAPSPPARPRSPQATATLTRTAPDEESEGGTSGALIGVAAAVAVSLGGVAIWATRRRRNAS